MTKAASEVVASLNPDAPRFYGNGGRVHRTGHLDIEVLDGKVVSVWFRCQPLPFKQCDVDVVRAKDMRRMYHDFKCELHGVEVTP